MRLNYAIVFVSDMDRSVAFYKDLVGLPLKFQSPGWTEFATDGATLALHHGEEAAGAARLETAGICRPGFAAADLEAFHQRMVANAVPCVQEPQAIFGGKVAQYLDPDGLTFLVGEER